MRERERGKTGDVQRKKYRRGKAVERDRERERKRERERESERERQKKREGTREEVRETKHRRVR